MLGVLNKSLSYKDKILIKTLYCTFVRPLLKFAVPVWCPYLRKGKNTLERVQRRATNLIPELRNLSYQNHLKKLNLTTLETRRQRGDMIQYYKFNRNIEEINWFKEPQKASSLKSDGPATSIRGHKHRLECEKTIKCLRRFNFFANRIVNKWNRLPSDAVEANSVNGLKARLDNFFKLEAEIDLN